MRKCSVIFVLFLFLLLATTYCFAQENTAASPITIEKSFWGNKYIWNEQKVQARSDFTTIMADHEECLSSARSGNTKYWSGMILAGIGGALVGYPLGQSIGGEEDVSWEIAYVGGGLSVIGIVLSVMAENSYKKAANCYNAQFENTSSRSGKSIDVEVGMKRANVLVRF